MKLTLVAIFALLLLTSHGDERSTFIEHEVCDADLPLHCKAVLGEPELYRHDSDTEPIMFCYLWMDGSS